MADLRQIVLTKAIRDKVSRWFRDRPALGSITSDDDLIKFLINAVPNPHVIVDPKPDNGAVVYTHPLCYDPNNDNGKINYVLLADDSGVWEDSDGNLRGQITFMTLCRQDRREDRDRAIGKNSAPRESQELSILRKQVMKLAEKVTFLEREVEKWNTY